MTATRVGQLVGSPADNAEVRQRSREWTATAPTEERVVREMARCLRAISEGRIPK